MSSTIDEVIERNLFREDVYNLIPRSSKRILDFGCNEGELLLRLKRDKDCSELFGIELRENCQKAINDFLDCAWNINLEEDDACLGKEYYNFFNYIVMHDVVEHLYDPWFLLAKLRKYLAPGGRLIVVTPNFQYWGLWSTVVKGNFNYGVGGLTNEEHIRWFSFDMLSDLMKLSGYACVKKMMFFPPGTDLSLIDKSEPIHEFAIPPKGIKLDERLDGIKEMTIHFEKDIRKSYERYLANKLLFVAKKSQYEPSMSRIEFGQLKLRRDHYKEYLQRRTTP